MLKILNHEDDTHAYSDLPAIYGYISAIDDLLRPHGLRTAVDGDLRRWRNHISKKAPKFGVTRALDPDYNDLRPGNSYWVKIVDHEDRVIACQADRICPSRNFIRDWIWTHRLYGDKEPIQEWCPISNDPAKYPMISGTVIYGGGTWVDRDYGGLDIFGDVSLGGIISRLGRMHGVSFYAADYFTGTIVAGRRFGTLCGLDMSAPLTRDHIYPGRGKVMDVDFWWASRAEIVAQANVERSKLRPKVQSA